MTGYGPGLLGTPGPHNSRLDLLEVPMRKPEGPEDDATVNAERKAAADEERGLTARRQVIQDYIAHLKDLLERLRNKLH